MFIIFFFGGVGRSRGNVFNLIDFYIGMGEGLESGLIIGIGLFGVGIISSMEFDVEGGNVDFFVFSGNVLSGKYCSVRL